MTGLAGLSDLAGQAGLADLAGQAGLASPMNLSFDNKCYYPPSTPNLLPRLPPTPN